MRTAIYTNGKSLFTLESFGKTAGACEANEIELHSEVSLLTKRAMHSRGQLHYVIGHGDRQDLKGLKLSRRMKLNNFEVI